MASLPVIDIGVDYRADKGTYMACSLSPQSVLILRPDKIKDFLSNFKGSQEKDLAQDFASIDIRDDQQTTTDEPAQLKYMNQLVRVKTRF